MNDGSQQNPIVAGAIAFVRARRYWLIAVAAALLLYTVAGFLVVPPIAKRQIVATLEATLQRPATLAELRINPFALRVDARDFSLTEADGSALIAFDRLLVDFQASSLFRRAWTFREVQLERPAVEFVREGSGVVNLTALATGGGAEVDTVDGDSAMPGLFIGNFVLADGVVNVTDRVPASDFTTVLGPISVEVNEFSTLPARQGQKRIVVNVEGDSRLEWTGVVQMSPLSSSGRLTGVGSFVPILSRYLQDRLAFSATDGRVELGFEYRVGAGTEGAWSAAVDGLDLTVLDVALQRNDEDTAFLTLPTVRASGGSLRWPESAARVDRLLVEGASVTAHRSADGNVNLQNLLVDAREPTAAAATVSARDGDDASAWSVELGELAVTDLTALFTDSAIREPGTLQIADFNLTVRDLSNADRAQFPFDLEISTLPGGHVSGSGTVSALPEPVLNATVSVDAFELSAVQPYLDNVARVTIDGGTLSAEATASSDAEQPMHLAGSVSVQGLELSDANRGERLIGWETLDVELFTLDQAARTLEISDVVLRAPYARLFIDADGNTNFEALAVSGSTGVARVAPQGESESERDADAGLEHAVSLGRLRIESGVSDFTDLSLPLPFAANISALDGELSALVTSSAEPAQLMLEGQIGEFGLAQIEGRIHPRDPREFLDVEMFFRNVAMPVLSPYTARFAGRTIDDGRLELNLRYSIDAGGLTGENDIVISDLALGERVEHPDAMDLPLDLAVALLTGPDGRIDLDLPVRGNLDDPQFRISSVIMTAFRNLITGFVTSPFRLLGRLIGVESENFDRIEFEPGDADLAPPEREKLGQLAEALTQRPNVGLVVPGAVAVEADSAALRTDRVDARIDAGIDGLGADVTVLARRRQVLESLYARANPSQPLDAVQAQFLQPDPVNPDSPPVLDEPAYVAALRERLIETEPVSAADLEALASARARAIREALTSDGRVAPDRVALGEQTSASLNDAGWVPLQLEIEALGRD